jgi:hypothetical protein
MNRLIQPLADILSHYPDLSAEIIVVISVIFSVLAIAYVALQKQERSALKESFEFQKHLAEKYVSDQNRIFEQSEKIQELVDSKMQLTSILERLDKDMKELVRENLDLETNQKIVKLQENLTKVTTANQVDVEAIKKAISTKEDRRKAFRASRKEQNEKFNILNILNIFFRRNKD